MYITFLVFVWLAAALEIAATQMCQRHMSRSQAMQIMGIQIMMAIIAGLAGYTLAAAG